MFSEGREDVNDKERAGRPSTTTTDEKINEVEKMILANRRITVREVAEDLNISIGSCHSIFINDLGMRRVAAKFVPKLLNCDQKQHRMNIANEMLDSVSDDSNFFQRVITGDEASQHCTTDQLFYFCQSIIDSFQEKPPKKTTAIFLDMTSAFDRVWREKLREKLHNIGIRGETLTWIADFLRGRRLKVWVNGEFSTEERTCDTAVLELSSWSRGPLHHHLLSGEVLI
ncbi:hypothetical protein LAZ67_X002183 [Cordylochernes scorpioides]|uniref:Reverse transcriptase domain-containing protein n=1 Tax=Cordylochernes scorpioides TaxID=51811 RepID=A0ABY6LVN9_9ARAC|nr:hypothetical protein LAZ67_X002183 [Cordylochernes scorpioides]